MRNLRITLGFLIVCVSCLNATSQCGQVDRSSPLAVAGEVSRIFEYSLNRMQSTALSGTKAITWIPPKTEDEAQVKCLGSPAIPSILEHLNSNRPYGQLLAVRMLGWIGGAEITEPLKGILASSDSQTIKIAALQALCSAPSEAAIPVLTGTAESDQNPYVRKKAVEILGKCHKKPQA